MLAKDVMSSNVITVRPHLPARVSRGVARRNGFTSAPVVTAEGLLRGIVTEADLMRGQPILDPDQTDDEPAPDTTVGEVMTPEPVTMRPTDELADVAAVMLASGVRSVLVVEDGRLVGIISRRDVLRCVARRELVAKGIDPESRRATMGLAGSGPPALTHRRPLGETRSMTAELLVTGLAEHHARADIDLMNQLASAAVGHPGGRPWRLWPVDNGIEIRAERKRGALPSTIGERTVRITAGAALANIRLGIAALGHRPVVTLLPTATRSVRPRRHPAGRGP